MLYVFKHLLHSEYPMGRFFLLDSFLTTSSFLVFVLFCFCLFVFSLYKELLAILSHVMAVDYLVLRIKIMITGVETAPVCITEPGGTYHVTTPI